MASASSCQSRDALDRSDPLRLHVAMKFSWFVLGAMAAANGVRAQVLYDVSFEPPVHNLGGPSSVGVSPYMPSDLQFGGSEIVAAGSGYGQALQLLPAVVPGSGGTLSYSQFQFNVGTPVAYEYLRTHFDLNVANLAAPVGPYQEGLGDGFTLLFDSPSTVRLDFIGGGSILQNGMLVGNFTQNSWVSVTVDLDLATNTWDIYLGSTLLTHTQFFYPYPAAPLLPTSIDSIRINLADDVTTLGVPEALIDNIQIAVSQSQFTPVPEPSVLMLLAAGSALLCAGPRMRRLL